MPTKAIPDFTKNRSATLTALKPDSKAPSAPSEGWLRASRLTLGQSQAQVAGKIGIKRQAYANFETGEVRSTISLATLRRAAGAMDCDLVYYLVPKSSVTPTPPTKATKSKPPRKSAAEHFITEVERPADELPVQLL